MTAPPHYLTRTAMERRLAAGVTGFDATASALADRPLRTAEDFLKLEQEAELLGRELADQVTERAIMNAHVQAETRKQATHEARQRFADAGDARRVDNLGPRPVGVQLPGGGAVWLETTYLRPNRAGMLGRPREKRGVGGSGAYPVLELLGIEDGVTPLTRSKVGRAVVLCSSFAEARDELISGGLNLDISTMVKVAVSTGASALERRDAAIAAALVQPLPRASLVAGKRVRVSVDGGRARTRSTHFERRKQSNGRRAFDLQWREPRIITVDVLDDEGKMDHDVPPIYEVELGDADRTFEVLAGVLRMIGANQAALVVFVSDGADWIWARVDGLIERAEIHPDRARKILDFYHASEHIADALKACKNLTDDERSSAHRELAKLLVQPAGAEQVLERLRELAKGRRSPDIKKEIAHLEKHLDHMTYAQWRQEFVPIGSGIVESAVRRIINMRFKAASMCWREDHLFPLMYLRCILKSGRWDAFIQAGLGRRHWLGAPRNEASHADSVAAK